MNSVGVKNYTSYQQGLQASISTFTQSQWSGVVNGFRANNPAGALQAIRDEYATWGGSINFPGAQNVSGTAGGGAGTALDSSGTPLSDSGCLWKLPSAKVGPVNLGGGCILARSQGRALLGGASILGGVTLMALGLGFLVAGSRAGKQVVALAPGVG